MTWGEVQRYVLITCALIMAGTGLGYGWAVRSAAKSGMKIRAEGWQHLHLILAVGLYALSWIAYAFPLRTLIPDRDTRLTFVTIPTILLTTAVVRSAAGMLGFIKK